MRRDDPVAPEAIRPFPDASAQSVNLDAEQLHMQRAGLTAEARTRVIDEVRRCLHCISQTGIVALSMPEIRLDMAGRSAGQYRLLNNGAKPRHQLRFNPYLLARDFDDGLKATVPHEVAHYAVAARFGLRRVRPHGTEWQQMMHVLGASPEVTHRHDVSGLPVRRQQRWQYRCSCRHHELSTTRHRRVQRGGTYLCARCRSPLVYIAPGE